MRRKSERTKEKEKSSPEKKVEKTPRRSRRHSRRRKGSVSTSDRDESGAEENETSMRSSQEDTEEEQVASLEETSQVGAVITADLINTSEVEEGSQSAPTRSRRSIKKQGVDQVTTSDDVNPTANIKADSSQESEWKEDNTFWEEADSKLESTDSKSKDKDKDKEGRSPVWKVKSTDGKGGEIQKLKLCIVRPQEPAETSGKKKKRLSRSSTNQQKEKSDNEDNDSSKGSQEEEEKTSCDEKTTEVPDEKTPKEIVTTHLEDSPEEGVVQINISETEIVTEEGEADITETTVEEAEVSQVGDEVCITEKLQKNEEISIVEDKIESREDNNEVVAEGTRNSPAAKDDGDESPVHQSPRGDTSPASDDPPNTKEVNSIADCIKKDKIERSDDVQCSEKNDQEKESSSVSPPDVNDSADEKRDADDIKKDDDDDQEHSPSKEIKEEPEDPQIGSPKNQENQEADQVKNATANSDVKRRRSESSDDEKESLRNDSKESSPRFRQRRIDRLRSKEQELSPDESERKNEENKSSSKNRRHLERRSRSPQRREKISLKRSFSRKSYDQEQIKDLDIPRSKRDSVDNDLHQENKENNSRKSESDSNPGILNSVPRKRRWGQSNSCRPSKKPVLSISTASLKTLIPGAKPVPIGEVQLVQDEDVKRESELWEGEKQLERDKVKTEVKDEAALDKVPLILPDASRISVAVTDDHQSKIVTRKISIVSDDARTLQRSPSPPRHKATNVLFITNLVRPFTVNQLKELLARTGKIIEGGFWIDKIKSKCYVEYENETEAKETRHALHGVRWPVSNPKTLCVDFGKKEDMEMAQAVAESDQIPRKTEPLKVERSVDWVAEQMREKEREREVRDREKEKERERERDRARPKERPHHVPAEATEHNKKMSVREWDLGKIGQTSPAERDARYDDKNRDKERKIRKEKPHRSRSASPHDAAVRKVKKKEEDAPAKLLDDLFRKTKTTPCIYWLPLTAEQIVVKEEMRRKHMAEHERRMAEMRKAERERERVRAQQRQQRRASEREKRRRRSGSGSPKK